jgi:hypothetical protein
MSITRRLLLALAPLAVIASPAAQSVDCNSAQFNALTNIWKPQPDQNTGQVTAVELAAERKFMTRVREMFTSAFVPIGAIGMYSANYDILPQAVINSSRYGNTYSFVLSHHKIECRSGKPVALDVSLGNVSVQVNTSLVGEADVHGDASVGFSFLPRGYYQRKDTTALPQANDQGIQEFNFADGTTVWWLTRAGVLPFRVVTRREFLQKQIEILPTIRPWSTASWLRAPTCTSWGTGNAGRCWTWPRVIRRRRRHYAATAPGKPHFCVDVLLFIA